MPLNNLLRASFPAIALLCGGCGTGTERALVATKTNLGLDFDTQPPTAEVAFSRQSFAIQPAFDNGGTPPILAGFRHEGKQPRNTLASLISGGQAAILVSSNANLVSSNHSLSAPLPPDYLDLDARPDVPESFWRYRKPYPTREVRALVFGTDTTFGFKAIANSPEQQALRVGYHRKELVSAPVLIRELSQAEKGANSNAVWRVSVPSFIANFETRARFDGGLGVAAISNSLQGSAGSGPDRALSVGASRGAHQRTATNSLPKTMDPNVITDYFAIGAAATAMAAKKELALSIIGRLEPKGTELIFSNTVTLANAAGILQEQTNELTKNIARLESEAKTAAESLKNERGIREDMERIAMARADALKVVSDRLASAGKDDLQPVSQAMQAAGLLTSSQLAQQKDESMAKQGAALIDALRRADPKSVAQFLQAYTNISK